MNISIQDIASGQSGLVLSRKEADNPSNAYKYKRLTLRSLTEDGYVNHANTEDFFSQASLQDTLFTSPGQIILRLFSPIWPVLVDESCAGLLVPSQMAVLTVKDGAPVSAAFLRLYLASKAVEDEIAHIESGTAQRAVKLGTIMALKIAIPDMKTQQQLVELDEVARKKAHLYRVLVEQEKLLIENAMAKFVGGVQQ